MTVVCWLWICSVKDWAGVCLVVLSIASGGVELSNRGSSMGIGLMDVGFSCVEKNGCTSNLYPYCNMVLWTVVLWK